jgi:adenylate kinase
MHKSTIATALRQYQRFHLPCNVTLIGPPGSGKGTYGRMLSIAWNHTPLYSASTILRQPAPTPPVPTDQRRAATSSIHVNNDRATITSNLNTGTLVDCEIVSQRILSYLQEQDVIQYASTCSSYTGSSDSDSNDERTPSNEKDNHRKHFIVDGYPRTKRQIDIMLHTWPVEYHITHAIHLNIPNHVCEAKIMGRRFCVKCHGEPNIANVNTSDGFVLPPLTPYLCRTEICRPNVHWQSTRPDDNDIAIIHKRLADYRFHEGTLLDYYNYTSNNSIDNSSDDSHSSSNSTTTTRLDRCISVTPYHGVDDFLEIQASIEKWFESAATKGTSSNP